MDKIIAIINELIKKKFWGKIEFVFEKGKPVYWKKKTTGRF